MDTNRVPITYKNGKSEKELPDYKKLWQVAFWGFDTRIGTITNNSTTMYEIQAQYDKNSEEYKELDKRLKLFRYFQGVEIDRAKNGSKPKQVPKCWDNFQKISEDDTEDEIKQKNFENSIMIDKRPYFMKHLYSKYAKQQKDYLDDFNLYSQIKFGKKVNELTEDDKQKDEVKEMLAYYEKKNPLLETDGVMNRLSRYMESQLKDINKKSKKCDNQKIFDKLFNPMIEIDNSKLDLLLVKYKEYNDFKKEKQLKESQFSTYESYFKHLRNDCLEKISSNIQELANLAVYICYQLYPNKPKDFCWDVFGGGIVENLEENKITVKVPHLCETGDIEYLGQRYEMVDVFINKNNNKTNSCDEFGETSILEYDVDESIFDDLEE